MERKFFGRATRLALAVAFIVSMAVAALGLTFSGARSVRADATADVWSGDLVAAGWADTDEKTPAPSGYVLNATDKTLRLDTADAFAYFAHEVYIGSENNFAGYKVTLGKSIDLDGKAWMPIGFDNRDADHAQYGEDAETRMKLTHSFMGAFDGGNNAIYNFDGNAFLKKIVFDNGYFAEINADTKIPLYVDTSSRFHYGLFGSIGNAAIENLKINDFKFDFKAFKDECTDENLKKLSPDSIGAVVGYAGGSATVKNCVAGSARTGKTGGAADIRGVRVAGGVVGRAYTSYDGASGKFGTGDYRPLEITDCVNYLNIGETDCELSNTQKGGILGYGCYHGKVDYVNCRNYGNIYGGMVGGITSFIQQSTDAEYIKFENCYNEGDLTAYAYCNGGIIGQLLNGRIQILRNCTNKGDLTLLQNKSSDSINVGGIVGNMGTTVSGHINLPANTPIDQAVFDATKEAAQSLKAEKLYNYGKITGAATDGTYTTRVDSSQTRYYYTSSAVGGIFGRFSVAEQYHSVGSTWWNLYKSEITPGMPYDEHENYPYGTVELSELVNYAEVDVPGDYRGKNMYIGGLFGAQTSNQYSEPGRIFVMRMDKIANLCGTVSDIGFMGEPRLNYVLPDDVVVPREPVAYQPAGEPLSVKTATPKLENNGTRLVGIEETEAGDYRLVVPNTVTEIADKAFFGLGTLRDIKGPDDYPSLYKQHYFPTENRRITEIAFEENSKLETIGELAFAGTDIKSVELPASIKNVGTGAFAETQLKKATVSSGRLGASAFANNIFFTQTEVGGNVEFGNGVFDGGALRGAVVIATDKAQYEKLKDNDFFGFATYPVTIRYSSRGDILDSEIRLFGKGYAFDTNNSAGEWRFNQYAKLGTAYANAARWYLSENDATAAEIGDIDALLSGTELCDTITLYSKSSKLFVPRSDIVYDGNSYGAAQLNSLLAPSSDKISGSATIMKYVGFDGTETENPASICDAGVYEVKVVEGDNEYKFDITVARRTFDLGVYTNLRWFAGKEELLGGRVGSESVLRSIARYLGGEVEVAPADSDRYTVVAIDGNTANSASADAKTASATLAANNNYEFIFTGCDGGYGLSVNVADNGTTAYVFKTWYAVEMQNWFVGFGSIDAYTVDDRAFGDTSAFPSPRIRFSDNQSADLSFNLKFGGESVNDTPFTLAQFSRYLNSAMPAGKYELEVKSSATSYTEYKDDGTTETVALEPFSQTYEFEVVPAGYNESQLAEIDGILKGKTFRFEWDGNAHLLSQADRNALNAILERMDRPVRAGTVWEDAKYNDLYGAYELRFNVARAQTGDYVTESEIPVDMKDAQRYTVFYTLGAKNHGLSVDGLDSDERAARSFYVVNYRIIDVPVLASKQYNGQKQVADVSKLDTEIYTVVNEGGTNVGKYSVTLKFTDTDCYEWKDIGGAEVCIEFEITKASNEWIVRPTISNWVVGRYNAEENAVIGSSAFGYGDMRYVITDAADESKTLFDSSADGADKLASLKVGNYYIKVTIAGNDNYNGLESSMLFRVFKKPGMAWWGTLLIVIGALLVAAAVIFILWKKGVFRIVTDKIILAVKTRASVDAVIASVRAAKRTEEAKKTVEAAKRREKAEERRRKAAEEKNKPVEERAAALEAKAAAAAARAERMRMQSEAILARAQKLREEDSAVAEAAATKDGE